MVAYIHPLALQTACRNHHMLASNHIKLLSNQRNKKWYSFKMAGTIILIIQHFCPLVHLKPLYAVHIINDFLATATKTVVKVLT